MKYTTEINFENEFLKDFSIEKSESIYTDRVIISEKAKKIFLLTTFDVGEVPDDYQVFVKNLAVNEYELSINYIPVFFGCDYDDVVRVMDEFADKIKNDYM